MTLEQRFDASTLPELRRAVLAEAIAAGMVDDRAEDIVLVVHELAANVVRHDGGAGQLQMRAIAGELHCQVSGAGTGSHVVRAGAASAIVRQQWLIRPGHGLWLVRDIADRLSIEASSAGTEVTAVFTLPGLPRPRCPVPWELVVPVEAVDKR